MTRWQYIFYVLFGSLALASNPTFSLAGELEQRVLRSVVVLRSATKNYCASGVLFENGKILTANHAARELCARGKCHDLVVGVTEKIGADPTEHTGVLYSVDVAFDALDLALLTPPEGEGERGKLTIDEIPARGEDRSIITASYPGCSLLQLEPATIEHEDSLTMKTGTKGSAGSSGGAVLSSNGILLGVITRGNSELETSWGKLFGEKFKLGAVRLNPREIDKPLSDEALTAQISRLIEYHHTVVLTAPTSSERKWASLKFIGSVKGLLSQMSTMVTFDTDRIRSLLFLDRYPGDLLNYVLSQPIPEKIDSLQRQFEVLTLLAATESKGLRADFRTHVNVSDALTLSDRAGRADLKDVLLKLEKSKYPGTEMMWLSSGLWLLLPCIPLLFFYGWTLGYVWAKEPKGRKFLFSIIVALAAWPLSFIGYLFRLRRLRSKKAANE
jgi:hypothetical protein